MPQHHTQPGQVANKQGSINYSGSAAIQPAIWCTDGATQDKAGVGQGSRAVQQAKTSTVARRSHVPHTSVWLPHSFGKRPHNTEACGQLKRFPRGFPKPRDEDDMEVLLEWRGLVQKSEWLAVAL